MRELESHIFTEIEIDATADQVWAVLTDFEKLPEWSSSFQGVNKPVALGEVSTAYFKNPITGGMMEFTHEVIVTKQVAPLVGQGMSCWDAKITTFSA